MPNAPLKVGAYGADVASLQDSLRQLGFSVSASEMSRAFFGPATRQAVQQFQKDYQLANTGEFDQNTAAALSAAAALKPVPPPKATPGPSVGSSTRSQSAATSKPLSAPPLTSHPLVKGIVANAQLTALLHTSPTLASNTRLINDFIAQYAASKGPVSNFWSNLNPEFQTAVPELQLTLQLGTLTLNNPAMVSALRARIPAMTSPQDLITLSAADLENLIAGQNIPIPAAISGGTAANYAGTIVATLHQNFPGAYFAQALGGALTASKNSAEQAVAQFLGKAKDFDILNVSLPTYLDENGSSLFAGVDLPDQMAIAQQLAKWQRVARVIPDYTVANTLLMNGFSSAYAIAKTPRASFLNRLTGPLASVSQAAAIYDRAQQIAAATTTLLFNVRQGLSMSPTRAIGDVGSQLGQLLGGAQQGGSGPIIIGGIQTVTSGLATWQSLFGSTSYCACSDCRSIYSASAYFVDLMQYLQSAAPNAAGNTPYDVLLSRRPDLPYIKLNCANTDTELPYIDLVNEILEGFVSLQGHLDQTVAHNTPKDATPAELSLSPEYTNDSPYNTTLCTAVYPPTLPFDRWLETARVYLQFAGSSLWEVMSTCQSGVVPLQNTYWGPPGALPAGVQAQLPPFVSYFHQQMGVAGRLTAAAEASLLALSPDNSFQTAITTLYAVTQSDLYRGTPPNIALACENLGISSQECVILTGKNFSGAAPAAPKQLADFYGDPASLQGIWQVEAFIQALQITYNDLIALLETKFLNPNQTIMLLAPASAPCDVESMTIIDRSVSTGLLQIVTLDRMHRFVRLWKKLGWKIVELDKTITALEASDIDQGFLASLSAVKQLQSSLDLSLLQILSFWSELDSDGTGSLYLTLFQNKAVFKPLDPAFALVYVAPLAAGPTLQFPSPLFPNLVYDPVAQTLTNTTFVSPQEAQDLKKLSSDPTYDAAISALFIIIFGFGIRPPLPSLPVIDGSYFDELGLTFDIVAGKISCTGEMSDDVRSRLNFSSDPAYQTAIDDLYLRRTLWGTSIVGDPGMPGLSDHLPAILSALQLTAQDLALLTAYVGLSDPPAPQPATPLNLANLSILARYAFLAQALSLTMNDFIAAIKLMGVDPFVRQDPLSTLAFVQSVNTIVSSPFSISQLNYLYRHDFDPNAGIAPLPANMSLLLTGLQMGLAAIAHANVILPDPKGALLVKNLGLLLGTSAAGVALGLINGTGVFSSPLTSLPSISLPAFVSYAGGNLQFGGPGAMSAAQLSELTQLSSDPTYLAAINSLYSESQAGGAGPYSTPLAALPPITFPASLAGAISYDSGAQQLRCAGPLTAAAQTILLGLDADPSYQAAVNALRAQQTAFITTNFQSFLNPTDAITQLLDNPQELSVAQKVSYVTQYLMPYLTLVQSESLVTQTLCNSLNLDTRVGGLLLNTILKSLVSPGGSATAMADFLALSGDGLKAQYFGSINLTGTPVLTRVDPTVNLNAGFGLPDPTLTSRPFSVNWTGWIMPQYSETYTFFVMAGDGVRLVVNGQTLIGPWNGVDQVLNEASGSIALTAGQLYTIELDWYDHTASAQILLSWSSPSTTKAVIPQSQLFSGAVIQSLVPIVNAYILLFKTSLLVSNFALTPADLNYLYLNGADFAGVAPNDPDDPAASVPFDPNLMPLAAPATYSGAPFSQWLRLNAFVNLRNSLPGADAGILQIFSTAASGTQTTQLSATDPLAALIAQVTGWALTDIVFLTGSTGFGLSYADFINELGTDGMGLGRMQTCVALLNRLGISAQQLFSWTGFGVAPQAQAEEATAEDIQKTFKARYDDATWLTVGKSLNDQIRTTSKQALIAFILGKARAWNLLAPDDATLITSSDQLYEFFLIDVEMCTCMLTSRIVQANAAIQLFVERSLMNLEAAVPGFQVAPVVFDPTHWETMKNFRVWQAARMVFLYPEDYMVPELRDDMTPIFKDFVAALQQNPATNDSAVQAYFGYLTALNQVARLDVRASFWQMDPNSTSAPDGTPNSSNDVLHVFARTMVQPYVYYYRRLLNCSQYSVGTGAQWTPWELINVGIQADHLVPVVWDGRLYLFWPTFSQTADPSAQSIPPAQPSTSYGPPPASIDVGVSLNWSEYRQGAWSPSVSSGAVTFSDFAQTFLVKGFDPSLIILGSTIDANDQLTISTYLNGIYVGLSDGSLGLIATFVFSQCGSMPACNIVYPEEVPFPQDPGGGVVPVYPAVAALTPPNVTNSYDALEGDNNLTLAVGPLFPLGGVEQIEVLWNTPSYELVFPQQFFDMFGLTPPAPFTDQPFFYQDSQRVYFVTQNGGSNANTITGYGTAPPPSTVQFGVFYHPFACSFLKEVNRYGVPQLLTLANQAMNNDQGVLAGFVISPVPTAASLPTVSLSPGVLVYLDQAGQTNLYETTRATAVGQPPVPVGYLYYNLANGFHYTQTAPGPGTTDAFIGSFAYPFGPWTSSGPTLFEHVYGPGENVPPATYPHENVDFSFDGAYSIYNWELFFHIPLMIASRLSQNQQFQDADNWFRYIFNPTSNSTDPSPQRYWVCLPFVECSPWDHINGQIANLLYGNSSGSPICGQSIANQIAAWTKDPFDPFMIGRMRTVAFRMMTVMAYFDNQIAWGDYLFGQNTRESINEATIHYVRVKELLGPRPVPVPARGVSQDYSYDDLLTLYGINTDNLNDPPVLFENDFPNLTASGASAAPGLASALSMSTSMPYFCLPPSGKLLSYWDTVHDRLYKIRNCMNIQGTVQQLPLFAPPISPALLVAAQAAGVDLSSVVANSSASVGYYRFKVLMQKALELCAQVQSLGAALLSALEKQDAESLSLLRATQETSLLQAMQQMKAAAVSEAQGEIAALNASLTTATQRNAYYQGLVSSGLISQESDQLAALTSATGYENDAISGFNSAAFDSMIPEFSFGVNGVGGSPSALSLSYGGSQLSGNDNATAAEAQTNASIQSTQASSLALQAQWSRRSADWQFQASQASDDMAQIQAQLSAANFRLTIAQDDQQNLNLQIQNAQAVQDFLTGKYTSVQLYNWLVDQISTVFFQCYQMAFDLANRAEASFRFERCLTASSYIQFGYWDSLKKGLMSGERLYADLKGLEIAYLETDLREYEITKAVSLVLFDPWALITLKETGQCFLNFPEAFFDMDYPGHYFRRLKTVSLTIPCVTGPYTSVNCTLTLLNSKIRVDSTAGKQDYPSDAHFITNFAATQSIATSTAQNDSGMFEVNFQDDRYLPFEGAGLISTWQIDLPIDCNEFNFDTITDVVVNLRYTSRYGGDSLRDVAKQLAVLPSRPVQSFSGSTQSFPAHQSNLQRFFSLRHEFPTEWYKFLNPPTGATAHSMQMMLGNERFPYQYRSRTIKVNSVEFVLVPRGASNPPTPTLALSTAAGGSVASVTLTSTTGLLNGAPYGVISQPPPLVRQNAGTPPAWLLQTTSQLAAASVEDLLMVCRFAI